MYLIDLSMAPKQSTRKRPPQNRSIIIPIPDHEQPLSHWRSLKKEVLQLACNNLHLVDSGTIPMLACRVFDYHRNTPPNEPVAPVNISVTVPPHEFINYHPVAPPIPPPFTGPILEPVSQSTATMPLLPSAIKTNLASLADLVVHGASCHLLKIRPRGSRYQHSNTKVWHHIINYHQTLCVQFIQSKMASQLPQAYHRMYNH